MLYIITVNIKILHNYKLYKYRPACVCVYTHYSYLHKYRSKYIHSHENKYTGVCVSV